MSLLDIRTIRLSAQYQSMDEAIRDVGRVLHEAG